MKKILIINKEQYGQHIDSYKYCKHLGNKYNLKYLCFDQGYNKIKDEVDVVYVKKHNNSLVSTLIFVQEINKELKKEQYDLIFVVYFSFCSLLRLTNFSTHFLLDIRSSLIYQNYIKRRFANLFLLLETFFYKDITLISDSLRKFLYISKKRSHIIPLGADILSTKNKNYSDIDSKEHHRNHF